MTHNFSSRELGFNNLMTILMGWHGRVGGRSQNVCSKVNKTNDPPGKNSKYTMDNAQFFIQWNSNL